jgi:putative tricarboxylic transport membrane protein
VAVGVGVTVAGGLLFWGARGVSGEAGYGGVGPSFLPHVVSLALIACGVALTLAAWRGQWRDGDAGGGDAAKGAAADAAKGAAADGDAGDGAAVPRAQWLGFVWMSAGILANAALIERVGFVAACMVCYALAVRGLRISKGVVESGVMPWLRDAAVGFAIAAPVYWMFGKLLGISLPGLTGTGWL